MSRSYESRSRHCKLGRDCGVCHPGKPQAPIRDRRRGLTPRELLELLSPDGRRTLREVLLLIRKGRTRRPAEAAQLPESGGDPVADPDARARGTGA